MSSSLRATDDAVVTIDPSMTSARWPRRQTLSATLRRRWLPVAWLASLVAVLWVWIFTTGQHLLLIGFGANFLFFVVSSMRRSRDLLILDMGTSLLVRRCGEFTEEVHATEVASGEIGCVRPRRSNPIARFVHPEIWRIGAQQFVIHSKDLSAVLQRLTGVPAS